ncbi:hypothetical protein [Desulfovibrio falkowii]|uniref:hypothetical protein n=1 Tax=Desulfovibrio sp. WGS1351 TaxID=3366814 RepID=UPI00372D2D48
MFTANPLWQALEHFTPEMLYNALQGFVSRSLQPNDRRAALPTVQQSFEAVIALVITKTIRLFLPVAGKAGWLSCCPGPGLPRQHGRPGPGR